VLSHLEILVLIADLPTLFLLLLEPSHLPLELFALCVGFGLHLLLKVLDVGPEEVLLSWRVA